MVNIVDFGAPDVAPRHVDDTGRGYARHRRTAEPRQTTAAIDRAHLARYTLGDRALEGEILGLFIAEAPRTMARLRAAAEGEAVHPKDWQLASHTLKGSARAVGAWRVAAAAEGAEHVTPDDREARGALVEELATALAEVADYIARMRDEA